METSTKPQENRGGGDDFVMKLGNLCIDRRGSLIPPPPPPPKESSPQRPSIFGFLDSPGFQELSCWDSEPEETSPEPELPVTASLYPSDIWGTPYNTNSYSAGAGTGDFPGYGLLQAATNPEGSKLLMKCLNQGLYVQETFNEVFPDIFKLMCDVSGTKIFENLLRFCHVNDLLIILKKFVSEKENFRFAALCKSGSISIQAFVRRIAGTGGLEGAMTSLLLADADVIMTHKHGWYIFQKCFTSFGPDPNQRLYCGVLLLFGRLAMDPYGVCVINAAVDSVRGYARRDLLKQVVKNSEMLSFDPSGHFVVQHCLGLKDEEVNREICSALVGDFVELAQKQGGSYVVEKCLEYSGEFGRGLVLAEIFKDDRTLMKLARHTPGNYVVKMALIVTRIHDQAMCEKLVKVLQPQFPTLVKNAFSEQKNEMNR